MSIKTAAILANGLFETPFAKTAHGLVRGPSRYRILGVVDPDCAGRDAGEVIGGANRGIPIVASLAELAATVGTTPDVCIVGVATVGGVLPPDVRRGLLKAAEAGMTLVNGLHQLLAEDPEILATSARHGGGIIDIRKPRSAGELRFWTGEAHRLAVPRVALLGTDCAVGKRTTAVLLCRALRHLGVRAEMIYTGQTGWLQGVRHGFILDATPNDFVCGELERAILACAHQTDPQVMLIEGQSGLRNPSGPCGSELILAGGARAVVLQHAPGRRFYEDLEPLGCEIPPLAEELQIIRLMGAETVALTLNDERLGVDEARSIQRRLAGELGIPIVFPLLDGVDSVAETLVEHLDLGD